MLAATSAPALLLLASAVVAQTGATSSEALMTIQTSMPAVDCNCIQPPCLECSTTVTGIMSIPAGETPISTGDLLTTDTGIMSIPWGETPISTGLIPSDTGVMSIPQGETPISTGNLPTTSVSGNMSIPAGETPISTTNMPSSIHTTTPAASSRSVPPQVSTAAAPPARQSNGTPYVVALAVSAFSLLLGAAWTLS